MAWRAIGLTIATILTVTPAHAARSPAVDTDWRGYIKTSPSYTPRHYHRQRPVYARQARRERRTAQRHGRAKGYSLSLAGTPGPLRAKVEEILARCGGRVISAYRPGARIAGTRHASLHASHRAVDWQGPSKCAYALLRDWPGGVSIDYHRVKHIHISYAPNHYEFGKRFAHYQPRARRLRFAAK